LNGGGGRRGLLIFSSRVLSWKLAKSASANGRNHHFTGASGDNRCKSIMAAFDGMPIFIGRFREKLLAAFLS
jgi:hypothetical protein